VGWEACLSALQSEKYDSDKARAPPCNVCNFNFSVTSKTICPKCFRRFILKDDIGLTVNLMNAKRRLTERRYELNQKSIIPKGDD
jgi:hypothetical protein